MKFKIRINGKKAQPNRRGKHAKETGIKKSPQEHTASEIQKTKEKRREEKRRENPNEKNPPKKERAASRVQSKIKHKN